VTGGRTLHKENKMKDGTRFIAALVLVVVGALPAMAGKPRVAVLEFGTKAVAADWSRAGEAAQVIFIAELVKSGRFSVIDRERLESLMREKGLSLSGDTDLVAAIHASKLLGVEYILFGHVTEFELTEQGAHGTVGVAFDVTLREAVAALDCRLVATSTGTVIWADSARKKESNVRVEVQGVGGGVDDERMLQKVLRPIVAELAGKLALRNLPSTNEVAGSGPRPRPTRPLRPTAAPTHGAQASGSMEEGVNLNGADYRDFETATNDPKICRSACQGDDRCRAWTYVKPGVQGESGHCWLKDSVPERSEDDNCVSGVKGAPAAPVAGGEAENKGKTEYDTSRPGADYRDFPLRAADPALCREACNRERPCKAWTYGEPGFAGAEAHCWLKDAIPAPKHNEHCISGVKPK
jgi:curli biogenesis system outer membrane secretion channel CsgG